MEKIKMGDTITLDNNKEYTCSAQMVENNINYLYLISSDIPVEVKFAKQNILDTNNEITLIGNKDEKQYVFNLLKTLLVEKEDNQ